MKRVFLPLSCLQRSSNFQIQCLLKYPLIRMSAFVAQAQASINLSALALLAAK